MNRSVKSKRILPLFFVGIAVALITFGSLISFHQYKIWGKPLVYDLIGYKRDTEKAVKHLQPGKDSTPEDHSVHSFFPVITSNPAGVPLPVLTASEPLLAHTSTWFPSGSFIFSRGLRAPPLS